MIKIAALTVSVFAALNLVACSGADNTSAATSGESNLTGGSPNGAPAAAPATPMPDSLHWQRNSAEYQAGARQAFVLAGAVVSTNVQGRYSDQPWAVIVDGDETVLDNSQFQKEGWEQGVGFTPARWSAWVQRREAGAVPGAVGFAQKVHDLGGKLVVVTNRAAGDDCNATEDNLKKLSIAYDAIFCQKDVSDKNPRFKAIADGTASPDLPALDVVMWVGDNILDFPGQSQSIRTGGDDAFADFGARFVAIPNPMYGSWQGNPAE